MDKTIAQRLNDLRSDRAIDDVEIKIALKPGQTKRQRAALPGFDGRAARMAAISRAKGVTPFEAGSSPFEHMLFTGRLLQQGEAKEIGEARAEAAYAYREDMQKAEIAGLGAQVISDAAGGGGNRATLSEHKLFAMQSLGELKDMMKKQEYQLLERLVWSDEWIFLLPEPKRKAKSRAQATARKTARDKARSRIIGEILMVLDLAAVHYGFTMMGPVRERWARPSQRKPSAGGPVLRRARPTTDPARLALRP